MTARILFCNNASTTLAGAINNTATSLQLATGSGALFATPINGSYIGGNYTCMTLNDAATGLLFEILHVTAVVGDTLTVVRGQEGTTAISWLAGDKAANFWTAGSAATMSQPIDVQQQAGNYTVDTSGAANTITAALTPAPASYALMLGAPIRVKLANTNTSTTVVLNVNTLGNLAVVNADGSLPVVGSLVADAVVEFTYDGTNAQLTAGGFGSAARKNTGYTVVDPGTGALEVASPFVGGASPITGNTRTFVATDRGLVVRRSNSGSAMTDTLPGSTAGVLVAGWWTTVINSDATASITIQIGTGSGVEIDGASSITLAAAGSINIVSDGANYWSERGAAALTGVAYLAVAQSWTAAQTFTQVVETVGTTTFSSGTLTLNLATGTVFNPTLTAHVTTLAFTGIPTSGLVAGITLQLTQGGSGGYTVTWPGSVTAGVSGLPVLSGTAGLTDTLTLFTTNGGTKWTLVLSVKGG